MYASAASLALVGLLSSRIWETSPAAAVPMNSAPSAVEVGYTPIIRHLDSKGQLEWTQTSGGQVTHFSNNMANKAISNIASEGWRPSNSTLEKRWSGWTNIGKIAQKSAKYACINSGVWVSDGVVSGAYDKACKEFVSETPAGLTVDGALTVYRTIVAGTDGKNKKLNFRYFNHNKDTPLTKAMCDTVYQQLSSNLCQGEDSHGTDSQGGTIQIVDDDFEIGFDPDDPDD
ncbi:MAG: hypothetical protein LQ339_002214 [Xanthoria mediterranea]|nr:MAG: hypothetical protein LQ339_002214 [Xanthoria mediterranea]